MIHIRIGRNNVDAMIIIPGNDKYGLYQGSFLKLLFLTSSRNMLPINVAAANTATIFTIVTMPDTNPPFKSY